MPNFDLEHIFKYHAPTEEQVKKYTALRHAAHLFAKEVDDLVPDGPDKSAAIRKLREVVITALHQSMKKVWLLFPAAYDEYGVVGVYSTKEKAEHAKGLLEAKEFNCHPFHPQLRERWYIVEEDVDP